MTVLMVLWSLARGGAERQMALLAELMAEDHDVTVIGFEDGDFRHQIEEAGVAVELVPRAFRFDLSIFPRAWSVARRVRPDVVHSLGWISTATMLPFCRMTKTPLVDATIRGGARPARRSGAMAFFMARADHVVANNRAGLRAFGVPDGKGSVVYNGFDERRLLSLEPQVGRADDSPTTVIMTGRMVSEKDWDSFLEAAAILSAQEPGGWSFLAVGGGPRRAELIGQASDLVDRGVVTFPEPTLDVLGLVASADIGVLATDTRLASEGCSNSIMEYMACGLPVVATDCGGNPEVVVDGQTGILVPPLDPTSIADALKGLRQDPGRARGMGAAGRSRLDETFSRRSMLNGFLGVYEQVLRR